MKRFLIFLCLFLVKNLILASTETPSSSDEQLSNCLKECLYPLARMHMMNSDIYIKYDEICAILEPAAECARRCGPLAHAQFHQLSANFRLHCVEFEEEIEDHLSCLQEHTVKVEKKCNEICNLETDDKNEGIDKQKASCKQNVCNMKCHMKGLVKHCPESEKIQKKINVQKAKELEVMRQHENFNLLPIECQQLHDHKHVERILDDL